ncbi:hypothetical protein Tco_0892951 [Tanacetum coccineum]|uniref:Ribosomal protein S14 n=1 Tax=Tanacetum coccineum TaxID=301880 RepID=A0ABQ5C8X8_9ASTR
MLSTKPQLGKTKRHQRVVIGQADNKNDTWSSKQTNQKMGFYTKERPKEAQELQRCRIASLAIRVTKINPTVTRGHPMIARNKGPRLEFKRSVCRGLDPSLQAYKYKTSLTHKGSSRSSISVA